MALCLVFWLALALPGYVLVRRFFPRDLESGFFGVLGLSYLGAFALLAPFSIIAHLLHLPLYFMSAVVVLAIVVSVVYLAYRRMWGGLSRLFSAAMIVPALFLAADMYMSARTGSYLSGDTRTHVACIRYIVDHGITNTEPYVGGGYFFPPYHTNLLHVLHAACVQITGVEPLEEWFINLVWAKLVVFCGFYYLVYGLFERRWVAGLSAVFVLARLAPVAYLVYPNKIAPLWLLPLLGGFAVEVFRSDLNWRTPAKMAVCSFILGQVHGLYAIFGGILAGPALAVVLISRLRRRRPGSRLVAACLLALFAGAPFVLIAKFSMNRLGALPSTWVERDIREVHRYYHLDNGWKMLRPGPASRYQLLAFGALCALVGDRRRQTGLLLAGAATAAIITFVPPVCTIALKIFGPPHTIYRMHGIHQLAMYALAPSAVAYLVATYFASWWKQSIACVVAFFAGMNFQSGNRFAWPAYWKSVTAPAVERYASLKALLQESQFFAEHIPRGAVVLTDDRTALQLVMLCDCSVVIHQRLTQGIPDVAERRADLATLLAPDTPWAERRGLLDKYHVTYFLVDSRLANAWQWARPHVAEHWSVPGYLLLRLNVP